MAGVGSVVSLHRWPVKSMGGEPVDTIRVDGRGVAGDRTHALFDTFRGQPRRLTVRQVPRMLAWRASYDGVDVDPRAPPMPTVIAPGARTYRWDDPDLPSALADDLGRSVTLRRDVGGQQDLERSVLITTQASLGALADELGYAQLDLRRLRTNIHLNLEGGDVPAFAEEGWEGRHLTVGDAHLVLLHPCVRCVIPTRDPDTGAKDARILRHLAREHGTLFGINARFVGTGISARVAVGDTVTVSGARATIVRGVW